MSDEIINKAARMFFDSYYREGDDGAWQIKDIGYTEYALRNGYAQETISLLDDLEKILINNHTEKE